VLLLALGERKAGIIREVAEGPVSPRVPASYLQEHADATVLVDAAAGSQLTSSQTPWAAGKVEWTDALIKRAILWLCEQTGKALLKLTDEDFRNHNLHQLLRHHGPAPKVAHHVFQQLMGTITYHPAGKERRRVICFSPHPDDDVISMGGTLIRLVEQGHKVHVAYMTSGNIAVFDHDARRYADFLVRLGAEDRIDHGKVDALVADVRTSLERKSPGEVDTSDVQALKRIIRETEAVSGLETVGLPRSAARFLNLPFYQTGKVHKEPIGPADVEIVRALLEEIRPDMIFVAGDLSDPHGTHRMCKEAIDRALAELTFPKPEVWLYRGAWQEWPIDEATFLVPLSQEELRLKIQAIFKHQSQKDSAPFPGGYDEREFWQRVEARNKGTAAELDRLGLAEYFAMEAYVVDGR
jgi:glucosamine-6-phosphate deaminase